MQRAARLLLWGGLALLVLSIPTCIIGFAGGIGAGMEGDSGAAEAGGTIAGLAILAFLGSLLLIGAGALLKAFAPKDRE